MRILSKLNRHTTRIAYDSFLSRNTIIRRDANKQPPQRHSATVIYKTSETTALMKWMQKIHIFFVFRKKRGWVLYPTMVYQITSVTSILLWKQRRIRYRYTSAVAQCWYFDTKTRRKKKHLVKSGKLVKAGVAASFKVRPGTSALLQNQLTGWRELSPVSRNTVVHVNSTNIWIVGAH